jgi:hypothetical protein
MNAFGGSGIGGMDAPGYYPGTTRPIKDSAPQPDEDDPKRWDAKPVVFTVRGRDIEMFTIGQLGKALGGRKPVTIRKWETDRVLPKALFFSPSDDPRGKRRLYSRSQVEGLIEIARSEGVLTLPTRPIRGTRFVERALALWAATASEFS